VYPGKRLLDVALAAVGLVVLSPIFLVCALLVRLTSPGPVIYTGERVGLGERPFRQMKFRTMVVGADRAGFQTADHDPRITPIGRWLRRTSLDELPQLINVLRGEMSVVGPRPAAPPQLPLYRPAERLERARVRPGITGLAQVSGRSALTVAESIAYDAAYARDASLWLDLRIIGRTVSVVAHRSGSN
jgi:lipopolysaccharide/colanic/teichoic acid biosynthesis glycosyltransferase